MKTKKELVREAVAMAEVALEILKDISTQDVTKDLKILGFNVIKEVSEFVDYFANIDSSLTEQQRKAVEYLQTARELLKPQYYHEKFQMNVTRYRRYEV